MYYTLCSAKIFDEYQVCVQCARVQFALVSTRVCTGEHKIKFAQVRRRAIVEMAEAAAALHPPCQINHTTHPPMMTNMMVMSVYSSPPFFRHVPHSLQGYIFGGGHMLRMITG